jgi:transposase
VGRPYSNDLRGRVVRAVVKGGLSCHQAAAQFGVGISTAINWVRRFRETGSVEPDQIGGYKPKKIVGPYRDWLLQQGSVSASADQINWVLTSYIVAGAIMTPPSGACQLEQPM